MKLIVESSTQGRLGEFEVEGTLKVGRDAGCAIVLDSPYISKFHAEIEPREGRCFVHPLGLNPTYVNDRQLEPSERLRLESGDVVSMPGFTLRFVDSSRRAMSREDHFRQTRRYSELKTKCHGRLLDEIDLRRLVVDDLTEPERQARIRRALGVVVAEDLRVDGDLEDFIVQEAIRRGLVDRVLVDRERSIRPRGTMLGFWESDPSREVFEQTTEIAFHDLRLGAVPDLRARIERISEGLAASYERLRPGLGASSRRLLMRYQIQRDLDDLVFGLGPLEDLVLLPTINEIMVVRRDQIFIESGGGLEETGRSFPSDEDMEVVIGRIVAPIGRFVNRSQPIVDARLLDGSRVNIVIPPVALKGPAITIRKFRPDPFTIEDLIGFGTMNARAARFLVGCVRARKNIVISGGTGSGKTTLLNVLGAQIPDDERILVIEDSAELQLRQPNLVNLEAKKANTEGEGEISIRDLVRAALRMRPDRIVVGECRGKEALDMLQAMNTGHDGSMTTGHSNSPEEMVSRLEVMVLEAGEGLPVAAIHRQIAGAVDLVVQIQRQRDRVRRITRVTEVVGFDADQERVVLEDIFRLGRGEAGPELQFVGYLPTFLEPLVERGDLVLDELF